MLAKLIFYFFSLMTQFNLHPPGIQEKVLESICILLLNSKENT